MSEQPSAATDQLDPRQFDIVMVDQSEDARSAARSEADARLTAELNDGGRVKRFMKSIWKGNIAKDYYRHKYEQQALQHIEATQDILIHESDSAERRTQAMEATIDRFQSEYEEMIHTDAGERRQELANDELADGLKNIIREYAAGTIDDASLQEERTRLLQVYRDEHGTEVAGEGVVQVDNLLEVARAVRGAVEHGHSVDAIVDGMRVIAAESRAGVRSEVEYTKTDQIIDKLGKSKVGLLLGSEATIAAASIAASMLRFGSQKAIGAAAMTVAPGIGAGLLAGLREKKRVKDDRAQHARELAQGKTFSEEDHRRVEMETTRYETAEASELTEALRQRLEDGALDSDDALQEALDQLAAITEREYLSDTRGIDLITYSDATEVERERFDLALARAEVKAALNGRLDQPTRQRLGLDENNTVDELIQTAGAQYSETYLEDIDAKDQAFRKLRNRRVAKAAAAGAVTGLVFGTIAQEIGASFSSTREGLMEQAWQHGSQPYEGSVHQTLLDGMFGPDPSQHAHDVVAAGSIGRLHEHFGTHGNMTFSDNLQVHHHDGSLVIKSADGDSIANVHMGPDGHLSDHAQHVLKEHGLHIRDLSHTEMHQVTETKTVGLHEFMHHHHADTTRVARDLWYDNNTPSPVFDQNELGLHWGGDGGSGVAHDGHVVLNVNTMQADGSFHDGAATNWADDARTSHLKLAVSPSTGTQAQPFMVDISPDGTINLPPDSPAAQFFSVENGHAVFNGRYAEVVQMMGKDGHGVEHIRPLATLVGNDNVHSLTDTVTHKVPEIHPHYVVTMEPTPHEVTSATSPFVEMAPVIPVVGRRSLEAIRPKEAYAYSQYGSPRERQRMLNELDQYGSPRLRDNPDATLNMSEELDWHYASTRRHNGAEYVDEIEREIGASPELSGLTGSLESIVTIPVKASGVEESETIYDQLRMYAMQGDEALAKNMMLLHINWPVKAESDSEAAARIQKTKDEIDRARRDFPGLKVATIESRWTDEQLEGGVIGRVSDKMRDAALMSLRKAIQDGRMPGEHEVMIIRNDADAKGIHKKYLEHLQNAFESNGSIDIFTGTTRFDERRAIDLPGMVLGQHFAQSVDILETARYNKTHTGGANFGVRASVLAAVAPVLERMDEKGVGTDDVAVGRFITAARRRSGYSSAYGRRSIFSARRRPYYSVEEQLGLTSRQVSKRVVGAQIDTDSQRSEEVYLLGGGFHDTWSGNFDDGGHRERGIGAGDPELAKRREELKGNLDEQLKLLEKDVQHTVKVSGGTSNPAIRTALEMMFGGLKNGNGYQIKNGRVTFTKEGFEYLHKRMRHDQRGRFDKFGARMSRQLYGEVSARAKRTKPNAPLLSAS